MGYSKEFNLSKKMLKRWSKDYNLPIKIFEEPYFSYLIDLYDNYFKTKDKLQLLKNITKDFSSDEEYLNYNNNLTDNIVKSIREKESYKQFNSMDMSTYTIYSSYPKNDIYKQNNINKFYISFDLVKANYQSLKFVDSDIVFNSSDYNDFLSIFTKYDYIKESKYIRQVIFGQLNPKRQQKIQRYLIEQTILYLLNCNYFEESMIAMASTDEVIFEINKDLANELSTKFETLANDIKRELNIDVDIGIFKLDYLGENSFVKEFLNKEGYQFACVPVIYYPQIYKKYNNLSISDEDLVFTHENQLVKFLKPIF